MPFLKTTFVERVLPAVRAAFLNDLQDAIIEAQRPPLVTSLPNALTGGPGGGPLVDGQEIRFLADATNAIVWNLKYRAAEPGPYKWYCIGGDEMRVEINTSNNTYTTTAWTNSPGVPQLVNPLAGDYICEVGNGYCGPNTGTNYDCGIRFGAGGAIPAQPIVATLAAPASGNIRSTIGRRGRKFSLAAGTTLIHQFDGTGNGACDQPFMAIMPVRVG